MKLSILAIALGLCTVPICADPVAFYNIAAWNSAAAGLQQNTIDFTNISTSDQNMSGYTEDGATFTGTGNYLYGRPSLGGFIYGPQGPGSIRVDLPVGTVGVGFDVDRFYGTVHPTDFILPNGTTFTMSASQGFIGFMDPDCIAFVTMRVQTGAPSNIYNLTSDFPMIYNAYLAVDPSKSAVASPEPATSALIAVSAAAGLLWHRRRRSRN